MTLIILGGISIFIYLFSTALLSFDLYKQTARKFSILPAWLAVLCHLAYTFLSFIQDLSFNFSFFNSSSLMSSLVALILLIAALKNSVDKIGIIIFPLASLSLLMVMLFSEQELLLKNDNWKIDTHIFSSIIAFSFLNIAALQAILLAIQEKQLRKHPPPRLIQTLPALQTMETLLFQMIATGVFFLSLSLISGVVFIEDLMAQRLAHKTILSMVAWLTFSALLVGKKRYGWRGQVAVKWTLTGFSFLVLAYFGTKLVLELVLERI